MSKRPIRGVRGIKNQRRAQRTFRAMLANHNVAMLSAGGKTALVDWKSVRDIVPSPMVVSAFEDYAHFWTVYGLVWSRDFDGRNRLNDREFHIPEQRMFRQLQNHHKCKGCRVCDGIAPDDYEARTGPIQPLLDELVDSYSDAYILGSGWLAVPRHDPNITTEQLHALVEAAGVWATSQETKYEKQQRENNVDPSARESDSAG